MMAHEEHVTVIRERETIPVSVRERDRVSVLVPSSFNAVATEEDRTVVGGDPTRVAVSMPGIPGPPGPAGGNYVFTQETPATTWTIVHNLGFRPAGILIQDTSGNNVEGEVTYPSPSVVVIDFSASFAGTAYLS